MTAKSSDQLDNDKYYSWTKDDKFAPITVVMTKNRPDIPEYVKTNILIQHYGTKH
jgi:hypothetical protein